MGQEVPEKCEEQMLKYGGPEIAVNSYRQTLCNTPEERRPHLHRGGSLISNVSKVILIIVIIINNVTHYTSKHNFMELD
jgi:hypothetical protein